MQLTDSPLFSCIDLFCGCGGNSWGMLNRDKSRPLTPLLALDIDPTALTTYQWNMPTVKVMQGDIRSISPHKILNEARIKVGQLGCLVASPPCQTYSRNNRRSKDKNDYRNTLYKHTLRIINKIKPWVVFMENVPDMESYEGGIYHLDFLERLEQIGYAAKFWTVNAADYGVPQIRHRLIYLAYRKEMNKSPRLPEQTHGDQPGLHSWVTGEEAIGDLPPRYAGQEEDEFVVDDNQTQKRSQYALNFRPQRSSIVFNQSARKLNSTQLRRLRVLEEGQAYDDLPNDLKPKQGYKASYGRIWRGKPVQTLTAYLAYPSCGRFSHYEQDRVITIREALRLQSFNDDFKVFGELMQQSNQVGNAVPPFLATAFKNVIVADLEDYIGISRPDNCLSDQHLLSSFNSSPA